MGKKMDNINRDGFTSKWGFILASIGSAVGMGNIWRFPIMVSKWGGVTFLIPYILCVILIGSTGVIGEFALGRSTHTGPIGAFGRCTQIRSGKSKTGEMIGWIPVLGALGLAIGYTVVLSWIFKYAFMAISGNLYAMGTDMSVIGGTFGMTAPETASIGESISAVLSGQGNGLWIVIGLVVSLVIMAMGVAGGIEKANKVMMPVLFFLFLGLAVYIFTLPGASDGYAYIFTLQPSGLLNLELWIFAFGQAFFSLSVAGNGSIIYGSYLSDKEDIPFSARNVAFFDTVAAMLAAFVILPAMAAGGAEMSSGGPGLMFVYLVNVLNGMPGGRIIGMIFYLAVLFAGLSSIVNLYEVPVAMLQERFGVRRILAVGSMGVFGGIIAFLIQGYTSQWMDIVSIYICPLGAFLAGVMFFWIAGREHVLAEINKGREKPVGEWFYPLAKYVYCTLCIVALVAGIIFGGIG